MAICVQLPQLSLLNINIHAKVRYISRIYRMFFEKKQGILPVNAVPLSYIPSAISELLYSHMYL